MKRTALLSADQISLFCYQLALLQKAGIAAEEGVSILSDSARTPWEKNLLGGIRAELDKGQPLSEALTVVGVFPDYMLRMISIGQLTGRLDQVLEALSDYYQRENSLQSAIRRAIAYPAVMAVLIAAIFLVLMAQVFPVFQQVFDQLGMSLSPLASAMLRFGDASQTIATVLSIILIVVALFMLFLFRTAKGTALMKKLELRFLSRNASNRAINRSRFASAMSLMISSGLPLDESLQRTSELLKHTALEPKIEECRRLMNEGVSFPASVQNAGILNDLQASLLASGFHTGVSEQAMSELARRCQEEADERLSKLLSRVQYSLVLVLCVSVGLVLLSVMLPLLGVVSAIGG